MKSIVCYGPKDIRLEEQNSPVPKDSQVLIKVAIGGICGSDLHYYNHGGFGDVRIREPMILGHEVAGTVMQIGKNVTHFSEGDLVAVNPSRPCGECNFCAQAIYNQCFSMRYYGSAMRYPHIQGAFSEELVADANQCAKLDASIPAQNAAFAEPLAVALSAVNKLGNLMGKRLLVTGTGPVGGLVVIVAKLHGAIEVVATDIVDNALERALQVGANTVINVQKDPSALKAYEYEKGYFDAVIEASGNEEALKMALNVIKPCGRLVLLGLGGDVTLPLNQLVSKEINMTGNFRFHKEFFWAVQLINDQRVCLQPLLTDVYPIEQFHTAFEAANNRQHAMKVQLSF